MGIGFLLALQAAGMVVDYLGTQRQSSIINHGANLQLAGIENQIAQNKLQAEDASLIAMRNLRQNLGTQMAVYAARGTNTAAGSAALFSQQATKNFNEDERMRRMNLLNREYELRGNRLNTQLNQQGENSKLWQGFAQRTIKRVPISSAFGLTQMD